MTLLYHSPIFQQHDTGSHPEKAERLRQIDLRLASSGLLQHCQQPDWSPAGSELIAQVHQPEYVESVEQYAARGGGRIEVDTVVSRQSYTAATLAAGAICDAVRRVTAGQAKTALCLVRPPGHHALADAPMGFCLLNNVAIGAALATRQLGLGKVLIVDWDVHHGNGTQAAFWEDPQVGFFSIHRWPFYPGTGDSGETGAGPGLGTTVNVPVEFGTSRREYLDQFRRALEPLVTKLQPELILLSAGFDSHRADPVGSLGLEVEDFQSLTEIVLDLASVSCGGRVVSVLEGGYNPPVLAESVETHLRALLATEPPPAA